MWVHVGLDEVGLVVHPVLVALLRPVASGLLVNDGSLLQLIDLL